MGSGFWTWATEHWFLGFFLLYALIEGSFRMICVALRGWPPSKVVESIDKNGIKKRVILPGANDD